MKSWLLIALVLVGACKKGTNLCTSDTQCATGFSCDQSTGSCRCSGDSSCASTETCNAAGFCQARLRCDSTADCTGGNICDTTSGTCIAAGTCGTLDTQCKAGEVCSNFTCVPGCRHDGDCAAPSDVCRPCPAGTPAAQCPIGSTCVRGQCDSKLTCNYGDLCESDGSDAGVTVCTADTRGPYCQPCVRKAGADTNCGTENSFCLIDGSQPLGQAFFCGVDCSEGQQCPFGYTCHDVRIVLAQNCNTDAGLSSCTDPNGSVACNPANSHAGTNGGEVNDDCDAAGLVGAVCDPNTSKCVSQCLGTGEVGVQAFCSCLRDSDCPADTCDSATRSCVVSGAPCIPGVVPDQCSTLHAVHCAKEIDSRLGDVGICRIGQNCAPDQGYTCSILLGQ